MLGQTFWTIVTAITIYVIGQIIQNFLLKPIQAFRVVLVDISHKVKFHTNILTNSGLPSEKVEWARGDMRDLSCNLESKYLLIPFKDPLSNLRLVLNRKKVRKAATDLIFLSNNGGERGEEIKNADTIEDLKRNLGLGL